MPYFEVQKKKWGNVCTANFTFLNGSKESV